MSFIDRVDPEIVESVDLFPPNWSAQLAMTAGRPRHA